MRLFLACALALLSVLVLISEPVLAWQGGAAERPIGYGARYLPGDSAFYLAADLTPGFDQANFLDRLAAVYTDAPEVTGVDREVRGRLGTELSITQILAELRPNLAGEVFVAVPRPEDWRALYAWDTTYGARAVNPDCTEPFILAGAAIRDLGALRQLLERKRDELADQDVRTSSDRFGDVDIVTIQGRSPELAVYLAVHGSELLVSSDRSGLIEAIARDERNSLASSADFREARARFAGRMLGFVYTSLPGDALAYGGGGIREESPTRWFAGALRLAPDDIRVEMSSSLDSQRLTPASKALLQKEPNPLRSASAAPAASTFFVGWDNLKLTWDQIVESVWPDPQEYASVRQSVIDEVGLDPEEDIFAWMTGEVGVLSARSADSSGLLGDVGIALVLEAKDRSRVGEKVTKIATALRGLAASPGAPASEQERETIAGVPFDRIPLLGEANLYLGMVDDWVVLTSASSLARDVAAAAQGGASLSTQPEFRRAREGLGEQFQFLGFIDVPDTVEIATVGVSATGNEPPAGTEYLNPVLGVGLSVKTAADRVDGTLAVHVTPPVQPIPASASELPLERASTALSTVAVDITHAGESWPWQIPSRFQRGEANPVDLALTGRMSALSVGYITPGRRPARPSHEAASSAPPDDYVLDERLVVRVGSVGAYDEETLSLYRDYVRCGGTLLLLSDGKAPGELDPVADLFGIKAGGMVYGNAVMGRFSDHPAARDLTPLPVPGGAGILGFDEHTFPLGSLSEDGFVDLDGDGRLGPGDRTGVPILAMRHVGRGTAVFLGTTSIVSTPDHPVLRGIIQFLFPGTPWLRTDASEPSDARESPRPLELDRQPREFSLHAGDRDWYGVTLAAGDELDVRVVSECRIFMSAWDEQSTGLPLEAVRTTNEGDTSTLTIAAPQQGRYLLLVSAPRPCESYLISAGLTSHVQPGAPPVRAPLQLPAAAPVQRP